MKNSCELLYLKEHLGCEHYIREKSTGFSKISLDGSEPGYKISLDDNFAILFVQEGGFSIDSGSNESIRVNSNDMVLLSNFSIYFLSTTDYSEITIMFFDRFNSRCDELTLEKMSKNIDMKDFENIRLLIMNKPIVDFVNNLGFYIDKKMFCRHLHDMKETEFLFLMRGFYSKSEVEYFFTPLLRAMNNFANKVKANYLSVNTVEELADKCDMTVKTFSRYFKDVFNDTPKQWMMREKLKYEVKNRK